MLARFFRSARKVQPPTIRVYHNCSPMSRSLYSKLHNHRQGYEIELQKKKTISKEDFDFLMEVVDMHPDNKRIIYKLFDKHPMQDLTPEDFTPVSAPLVIDYANKLVAADCVSLDRVMTHYNSCGMQNFTNDTLVPTPLSVSTEVASLDAIRA
ncbi:hypothetical protein DICA0_A11628 [Diutina catenulata]